MQSIRGFVEYPVGSPLTGPKGQKCVCIRLQVFGLTAAEQLTLVADISQSVAFQMRAHEGRRILVNCATATLVDPFASLNRSDLNLSSRAFRHFVGNLTGYYKGEYWVAVHLVELEGLVDVEGRLADDGESIVAERIVIV